MGPVVCKTAVRAVTENKHSFERASSGRLLMPHHFIAIVLFSTTARMNFDFLKGVMK